MFKGRIRSNLAIIRDKSRLDWITIKSRTCGDHEELNVLLKNRLIPSRFNQDLLKEDNTSVLIGKSLRAIRTIRLAAEVMDDHDASTLRGMSGHIPTTWAHVLHLFRPSDLDRSLLMKPRIAK